MLFYRTFVCLLSSVVAIVVILPSSKGQSNEAYRSEDDDIFTFPGQPPVSFIQRSGYISVASDDRGNDVRHLFYYLAEASNSPQTAPFTLWLNGGPGCSSLGDGGLAELGPFFPNKSGTGLVLNPHRWNQDSHILFLESPAGVGFSYFSREEDNTVGDERTALDTWKFLVSFFRKHPQFHDRPFYIAGESYGGHYVPQLADLILRKNREGRLRQEDWLEINLAGMAVGNAWTDAGIDNRGAVEYWWTHALVSDGTFQGLTQHCNFSYVGPLKSRATSASSNDDEDLCDDYTFRAFNEMGLGLLDIYDIYSDTCVGFNRQLRHLAKRITALNPSATLSLSAGATLRSATDPCIDDEVERYLNLESVQSALGVRGRVKWQDCSDTLNYSRSDLLSSVLPLYRSLTASGIKVWVYSGDVDAIVPVTGTRAWLRVLNLSVISPWRFWVQNKQIGGYVTEYVNLTFVTVRQAGHMVPYTQPERAFKLFSSFLGFSKL